MLDLESRFEARVSGICSVAAALAATAAATVGSALIGASATSSAAKTQASAADQAAQVQMNMYNQTRGDLMPYMQTGQNALSQLANLWGIGPGGGGGGGGYGGFGGTGTTYPNAQYGGASQTINIPGYGQVTIPAGAFGGAAGGGGVPGGGGYSGIPNAAAATQALTQFPGYQFGLGQGITALDRSAASRGLVLSGAQLQDAQTFGQQYGMQQAWTPYVTELGALATTGEDAAAKTGANAMTTGANVGSSLIQAGQASAAGQVGVANQLQGGIQNALLAYQMYGQGGMNPALTGSVMSPGYAAPTAIDTSGMGADLAAPIVF